MINALFICSRNRLRSPTAEQVFAKWPVVETDSAKKVICLDIPDNYALMQPELITLLEAKAGRFLRR